MKSLASKQGLNKCGKVIYQIKKELKLDKSRLKQFIITINHFNYSLTSYSLS